MAYSTLVDVLDATDQLLEYSDRGFFVQSLVLYNIVKELAIDTVFHYQIQLSLCLDNLNSNKSN